MDSELRKSTRLRYESIIDPHLEPTFGSMMLAEVNEGHVSAYATKRQKEGASHRTRHQELAVLSGVLSLARLNRLVSHNPVGEIMNRIKPSRRDPRPLERGEEAELLSHAPELLRSQVIFAVETGARASEQANLTWADVSFERMRITFRDTKDKEDRWVRITPRVHKILLRLNSERSVGVDANPYVFASPKGDATIGSITRSGGGP